MLTLKSNKNYKLEHKVFSDETSLINAYKDILNSNHSTVLVPLYKLDYLNTNIYLIDLALDTIKNYLTTNDKDVTLLLEDTSYINNLLSKNIDIYIDEIKNPSVMFSKGMNSFAFDYPNKGKTFQEMLFYYIDKDNHKDSDIYNEALTDRKLFSKIRNNTDYHPSKNTVLALGIALKLHIDDLLDLLNSAGYTLSDAIDFDLIIEYMISNNIYDRFLIDKALYSKCKKSL